MLFAYRFVFPIVDVHLNDENGMRKTHNNVYLDMNMKRANGIIVKANANTNANELNAQLCI